LPCPRGGLGHSRLDRAGKADTGAQSLRFDAHNEDMVRKFAKNRCRREQFAGISFVGRRGAARAQLLDLPGAEDRHGAGLFAELEGIEDDERLPPAKASEQIQPLRAAIEELHAAVLIAILPTQRFENDQAHPVITEQRVSEA